MSRSLRAEPITAQAPQARFRPPRRYSLLSVANPALAQRARSHCRPKCRVRSRTAGPLPGHGHQPRGGWFWPSPRSGRAKPRPRRIIEIPARPCQGGSAAEHIDQQRQDRPVRCGIGGGAGCPAITTITCARSACPKTVKKAAQRHPPPYGHDGPGSGSVENSGWSSGPRDGSLQYSIAGGCT